MLKIQNLSLDPDQYSAARSEGHTLVIAGPGAGKTRTLLGRVLHLLEEGVPPSKIYLLTFTLKTAGELQKRLESLGVNGVTVDTFHALAYALCRQKGLLPRLMSQEEQEALFKKVLKSLGHPLRGSKKYFESLFAGKIEAPEVLETYEKALKAHQLWDYRRLLQEAQGHHLTKEKIHLLVDEFQDLNGELISFLKSFQEATFFLVGDPAQAIYGFRGARPEVVASFVQGLPGLQIKSLHTSYRVPERILSFAENLRDTGAFPCEPLRAWRKGGELKGFHLPHPGREAARVRELILEFLGGLQMEKSSQGMAPNEIAVVARTRALLEPIKEEFLKHGIPSQTYADGQEVFKHHLDQFLQLVKDQEDLGKIRKLLQGEVQEGVSWRDLLPPVDYIAQKSKDSAEFFFRLESLRSSFSFIQELESIYVPLLTIHETKGLEFKVVILLGAEEGLLPLTVMPDTDEQEEKRLAYVALTRASERFYFTAVSKRTLFGKKLPGQPSRYFRDLPIEKPPPPKPKKTKRQKSLF